MKRGEVWWIDFEPSVGGETQKQRPSVIVSNDASNKHLNRVQVVPITSNVEKSYPSEAYVTLNGDERKAVADQLTTVSKTRCKNTIGRLSSADMKKVEQAIRLQLDMN